MSKESQTTGHPVATTTSGKVRGVLNDGVNVFKGIPYGASTSGDNRFMPPKVPVPWDNVRDALDYGSIAPQTDPSGPHAPPAFASLIGSVDGLQESEDCLVLNVWTRGIADAGKRPVMFWLHGGGFQAGSSTLPGYDGTHLCKRGDVVMVSINHRLNVLGFAYLGDLEAAGFDQSANVGMLDVIHALKWVRDNIEQFGGDPNTVMVFGESGGGRKVGTLLAMPQAKGLFHRAVIESGPTIRVVDREHATFAAQTVLDELHMPHADVRKLQDVPLQHLLSAYFAASRKHKFDHVVSGFAPVADGDVLPQHPFHPSASAVMPQIPMIVGTNRTELTLLLAGEAAAFTLNETAMRARITKMIGDKADTVIGTYRRSVPDATCSELFFLIASDYQYCVPSMIIAERRARLGDAPVYFYYFAWETLEQGGRLKSPHALEIPFVFDNTEIMRSLTGGGPRAQALADKVSDAWIAFARTGDPNTSKLPTWSPYNFAQRATMVFNDDTCMVNDPTKERRETIQSALEL